MKNLIGLHKFQLNTPCLVIDKSLLLENIVCMQQEINAAKKNVRPHVKTHKCIAICKEQIKAGAIGISAAKVSEALVLATHGMKNTLITSPVTTSQKISQLIECVTLDPDLIVVIDNLENAAAIHSALQQQNKTIKILIDIDPNVGRTGVTFTDALTFAHDLKKFSTLELMGIQCYAGNLQHIQNYAERFETSHALMSKAAGVFKQLKSAGFNCHILSGSGTGTYNIDLTIPEVTEVQPGSYTVMDAEYRAIGSKEDAMQNTRFKPALTLLTSIVSTNQKTHVTCDAGWKALYVAPTKPIICEPVGFTYDWAGDEHGRVTPLRPTALPNLNDVLELVVGHCDPTINLYDFFYITENDIVVDVWPIEMRGKSQ